MKRIEIKSIAEYALLDTDGEKLKEMIEENWNNGAEKIILDFAGITLFATMFFNAAIGRLVMEYGAEVVKQCLIAENLTSLGQATWQRSFENAVIVRNDPNYRHALETCPEDD